MKTQGFTLVELLAVIVILAVLALIATPVVLSIIDDTKESAMLRSAEMYLSGVENAVMRENMNSGGNFRPNSCTITNGNMTCSGTEVEVEVDGEVPSTGSITFENGKIIEVTLNYESGIIVKDTNGDLVYEGSESNPYVSLGKSEHKLSDGTIEVHDMSSGTCSKCGETEMIGAYYTNGTYKNWETLKSEGKVDDTTVTYRAFTNSVELEKLILADTILSIDGGSETLSGCTSLTTIHLSKKMKELGNNFVGLTNLTSIVFSDELERLEWHCFDGSYKLETITLPKTMKMIGSSTFANSGIKTINYLGTKEEWNNFFSPVCISGCPQITVHCTDGDIEILEWTSE